VDELFAEEKSIPGQKKSLKHCYSYENQTHAAIKTS
jgi:hypothetical protein